MGFRLQVELSSGPINKFRQPKSEPVRTIEMGEATLQRVQRLDKDKQVEALAGIVVGKFSEHVRCESIKDLLSMSCNAIKKEIPGFDQLPKDEAIKAIQQKLKEKYPGYYVTYVDSRYGDSSYQRNDSQVQLTFISQNSIQTTDWGSLSSSDALKKLHKQEALFASTNNKSLLLDSDSVYGKPISVPFQPSSIEQAVVNFDQTSRKPEEASLTPFERLIFRRDSDDCSDYRREFNFKDIKIGENTEKGDIVLKGKFKLMEYDDSGTKSEYQVCLLKSDTKEVYILTKDPSNGHVYCDTRAAK